MQEFVDNPHPKIQKLIMNFKRKLIAFNRDCNENEQREQVKELLKIIFMKICKWSSNKMYEKVLKDL